MAYVAPANIDGAYDPRSHLTEVEEDDAVAPHTDLFPDGTPINLETYMYWAKIRREEEKADTTAGPANPWLRFFSMKKSAPTHETASESPSDEKKEKGSDTGSAVISAGEYRHASGALRTASWGSVFYLITTDILGPYSAPFAFQQVGYGPGVATFIGFGLMAAYSGACLWWMFMKVDSTKYPARTFGDLGYRLLGSGFRHLCNILQSLQLIFNVGIIILGNGQGLSQMAKFQLCFSVCNLVWMLAGMILGQVRTLAKFGWLASLSIWMNVLVLIMTMASVAHSLPNYIGSGLDAAPVITQAINRQPFEPQLNGIMQIVFSYGGAMIFTEFMSEMRKPMDFWKAMACAQVFITFVYMFFGIFVYAYQGQFTMNPANQGISAYGLQTATNAISLTAGLIAAALYGNIGIKIFYQNIFVNLLKFPQHSSPKGKWIFAVAVLVYWSLAFVIGSAIPQFSNISSLIAAACIFQFTYTFPAIMILAYSMQVDAIEGDREYDPANPHGSRVDTWRQASRWKRALKKNILFKAFNFLVFFACLAAVGLAMYSSITAIKAGFATDGSATSFGCKSPVDN
ncbi:hypothetical protein CONPUDRAFT_85946 [Coniophora puteana RWD-64-598 SS2]|uniref:Amino acid transporter transmembrane domain-containing protein n=1 Tax=Coniophora puteana (strain RWD-64-598) TaxID=741705 RepID=R7SGN1_CONPW|nr:uncharacterized protein CONPUDRAFT_85946 [Coniophora puteana RWD-64-598 SS2]EIW74194.1 hypothetical protein CONPUDRAFT_85946 [Coniophora puteana RWD-64-598 SS2]